MNSLIPKVILIGLAASVSPVAVMVLITLMFSKRPLRNSLFFLLGFTLTLVAIAVVVVFVFHAGEHSRKSNLDAWIAIALMTAVTLVTLLIPILLYVIFPKRARKMLGSLKDWLFKHNKVIGAAILLLIGGVLLFNGIKALV